MTMFGARQSASGTVFAPLRRLVAGAMARDLRALVVPGADVALAAGLDLGAAGLMQAEGPRQANVLLVILPLPAAMLKAATVAYAQMPRPRAVLVLGEGDIYPLPEADATGAASQEGLEKAVATLRKGFAHGAFAAQVSDFDAPALQTRIEYTCPMHPEVVSDEPGNCPKCGMFLVPRETEADATSAKATGHDHGTHDHGAHDHGGHASMAEKADTAATVTGTVGDGSGTQYTCPMHPEVVSDEPGNCPKCGMNLEPAGGEGGDAHRHDAAQYTCPMHPEVVSDEPGNCPKCGMNLVPAGGEGGHRHHHGAAQYTCPMHPEVVSDEPGNCPKCGMNLVPAGGDGGDAHHNHEHGAQEHHGGDEKVGWLERIEPGFMSMIELTEGTPRSSDGLQMEWIDVPFGPLFPGLPGGLTLDLTLDGDTVAGVQVGSAVAEDWALPDGGLDPDAFVAALGVQMRLSPVSYRLLACRALAAAAGITPSSDDERLQAGALARERIAGRLLWLAQMSRQLGLPRVEAQAARLSRAVREAAPSEIDALRAPLLALVAKLRKTPFLARRLRGIGQLDDHSAWSGPGERGSDAAGRLAGRLDGIEADLVALDEAGGISLPQVPDVTDASGTGHAMVETARGPAHLQLELNAGRIVSANLDTPSDRHLTLVETVTEQAELADALVAVASLDLSPWEVRA